MPVQQKVQIYDTPKSSVDSLPPSCNRRSSTSTSSGYHSQTNLITSPTSNSSSPSVRSEPLPPPPVHADQHPGRLGRQVSAPCDINPVVPRRSVSQPTPASASIYNTPRLSYHSDDPALFNYSFEDPSSGYPARSLDREGVDGGHPPPSHHQRRSASMPSGGSSSVEGRRHTQNRCHTTATCQAPRGGAVGNNAGGGGGDEYEVMVHPASANRPLSKEPDYVYMHPAQSPANYSNYDFVPPASSLSTISEMERPTPYENHPLPQELKGAVPVTFQPKYENVEAAKRSRLGSIHADVYENVLANGEQLPGVVKTPAGGNERIYENMQETMSPEGLHYSQVGVHAKGEAVNPSVTRVHYDTINLKYTAGVQTLQRERSMERNVRS